MSKTKAHTQYRLKDKKRVCGVTTITGGELGWNKRVLIAWANRIGLQGISSAKYTDDKADIGTLAHAMVLHHNGGKKPDYDDYTKNQIAKAENSMLSYLEWEKNKDITPILIEKPLISEVHGFGGTPDLYCDLDGVKTLVDYKTGKGIYLEYHIQVAAYQMLLEENGYEVEKVVILNIPRSEGESFQSKHIQKIELCKKIFLNCLENYKLKKQIS